MLKCPVCKTTILARVKINNMAGILAFDYKNNKVNPKFISKIHRLVSNGITVEIESIFCPECGKLFDDVNELLIQLDYVSDDHIKNGGGEFAKVSEATLVRINRGAGRVLTRVISKDDVSDYKKYIKRRFKGEEYSLEVLPLVIEIK